MIDEGLIKNEVDQQVFTHIHGTRKWTMFLSIAGFVFLGLFLLVFLGMLVFNKDLSGTGASIAMMVPMIVLLAVYFFPIYFLFQFSRLSKRAITENDTAVMSNAFKYLKFHYRYMGILFILIICLYIVLGVIMVSGGILSQYFSPI